MTKRLPQFKPAYRTVPLRLQERDFKILKKIYEYRFLDSEQIKALFSDTVQEPKEWLRGKKKGQKKLDEKTGQVIIRRLGKLFHHGYLDRPRQQIAIRIRYGNRPMIYALGNKGAEALVEKYGLDISPMINWQAKNTQAQDPYILHRLMISKFRTTLELALRDHSRIDLITWQDGEDLKTTILTITTPTGKTKKVRVLPDALLGLQFKDRPEGRNRTYFFLEADRSTMPNTRFFEKKVLGYLRYYREGQHQRAYDISEFRVLTTTITPERRDNLRETITKKLAQMPIETKAKKRFVFACERDYNLQNPETILGNIWYGLTSDQPYSILPQPYIP